MEREEARSEPARWLRSDRDLPRVAFVGWRLGGELEQAIRRGRDRCSYVVVSMTLAEDVQPLVEWHRIPLLRWNSYRLRWVVFYLLAALRLRRVRADLVHAIGPTPSVPNHVDLDTVTYCHAAYAAAVAGESIPGSSIGWRLGERLARALERWWLGRRVGTLVALSESGAEELRRAYPGKPVVTLPRGLDLDRFAPDERERRRTRAEASLGPDDVVAVFVDQDRRRLKGLELALRAFAQATRTPGGPALLWVLGLGNERCAPLADELGVADRVRFLGYRDDPERWYRAGDVFVLPTAYEVFCRSAHEAAACGLPVVAPPVGGIRELIGADEAGMAVERDVDAVARALVALARQPALRERLGRTGRERAAAFGLDAVAEQVLALHASSLRARAGRGV